MCCLAVMCWHGQHGLRAKEEGHECLPLPFSSLSLLPLSSLVDDPSPSLPPRLSFCPSSRVSVSSLFSSLRYVQLKILIFELFLNDFIHIPLSRQQHLYQPVQYVKLMHVPNDGIYGEYIM